MRCFVGVRPDDLTRERLARLSAHLLPRLPGARRVATQNLHLTLAFIGELPAPVAREVALAISRLHADPCRWRIDHVGCFARAGVIWAGSEGPGPGEWALLARACLAELRVGFDNKPFVAHVTLLRDAPASARAPFEPIEPFEWSIAGAELLQSTQDPTGALYYRPVPAAGIDPARRVRGA
jgi:2'-5' RNA ligase